MTNEKQTISNLRKLKSFHNGSYGADIDRAIKALEQDPKEIYAKGYTDGQRALAEHIELCKEEQEPKTDGDCISREKTLEKFCDYVGAGMSMNDYDALFDIVAKMPSVQPKAKTGYWIKSRDSYGNYHFVCSKCGNDIATQYADDWDDKYCSECGAKMVESQESEV